MSSILVVVSGIFFSRYLKDYYQNYDNKYAIEWIYGMKDAVKFAQKKNYTRVYMTERMMQPYIFFLFYEQTPLPEYLKTVKYNETQSAPSNLIYSFGNKRFIWDEYNSIPDQGVLYVVRPSVYDGLFAKTSFDVVKLIKYPDGSDAFYLVVGR